MSNWFTFPSDSWSSGEGGTKYISESVDTVGTATEDFGDMSMHKPVKGLAALVLGILALAGGVLASAPAEARVGVFVGVDPWWGWPGPYYYAPPPVVYAPPAYYVPAPAAPAPVAEQPQSWYYCDNPKGYYPYVATCAAGWRQVPAQPR